MTRTLRLKDLESAAANASEQPFFTTKANGRNGVRGGFTQPPPEYTPAGVIFEEHFDDQPDFTSAMHSTSRSQHEGTHTIPTGWNSLRQDPTWAPSTGHPDRHESVEILASNSSKARGGTGKSYVSWRDSYIDPNNSNRYNSESILMYNLPGDGLDEVYVEYWITFSQSMIDSFYDDIMGGSKVFRIISHDFPYDYQNPDYWRFFGENNKPIYIWSTGGRTKYGVRNKTSIFRYSPNSDTLNGTLNDGPWDFRHGDWSGWYAPGATGGQEVDGTDPQLTDYKNGGTITTGPVMIDQVFGDEGTYVKMGHYVKMNSAPGVPDGELMQFIDDKRILHITGIIWTVTESPMKKWNIVAIGGNDLVNEYPNEERYEDWYSIDDLVIRDSLPEGLE